MLVFLLLPSCITRALWRDDASKVVLASASTRLDVEAMGVVDSFPSDDATNSPALLLRARPTGDLPPPLSPDPTQPVWLLLFPKDRHAAGAIVDLLTAVPPGSVDHCVFDVEWTYSPAGQRFVTARVELGGDADPWLEGRELGSAAAKALLASQGAIAAPKLRESAWSKQVDAAESVDWRVLLPRGQDGHGKVLAALPAQQGGDRRDLLVRVDSGSDCHYLRVPAAEAPLLCALHHDPQSLFDRYQLQANCAAAFLPGPLPGVAMYPLRGSTSIAFTSFVEGMRPRFSLPVKVLLTPLAAIADAACLVLKAGPVDLRALFGPEPKPAPARRLGDR
jgi:hypothetical protein